MNTPSTPLNLWRERYETLRRHFVENRQVLAADPFGLVLLLRQGMAGWMRTWRACTEPTLKALTACPESWRPPITTVGPQELTQLLADMTAPHLHPPIRI
jgi:hypothetical protein